MTEALLELPPNLRERLVAALEAGTLRAPFGSAALASALGRHTGEEIVTALDYLHGLGLTTHAMAAWIRTACAARDRAGRPELVWSGPSVPGLHSADTRHVFDELLGSAEHSIWASTYAFFDGKQAFEVLARRMDDCAGLHVTLLLNVQRHRDDGRSEESLIDSLRRNFWRSSWPGERRPLVYFDPRSLSTNPRERGVLHAKAIVRDEEVTLVTSANFTEAALDRNLEVGVLLRDRFFSRSLALHFRRLIEERRLERL